MPVARSERAYLLVTTLMVHALLVGETNAKTYTLGYFTGSKRRPGDWEYSRPGLQISGAINLAVEEVNNGELGRRGHRLEFLVAETYGDEERSILMAADLWTRNVTAYIGPQETCVHEGRMAAAFNLPMISYYCTSRETSNKKEFPTFARTRPPDTQISKSVVAVLKAFNWTKVSFMFMNVTRFDPYETPSVAKTILASLRSAGIAINNVHSWEESYRVVEHLNNPFHKLVAETYTDTRIYVILGNVEEHIGLLMALDEKGLLKTGEYWVVGVNTETYNDREPEVYIRGLLKHAKSPSLNILQSYFSIIASAPVGYLNFTRLVNEYRKKPPFNFKNPLEGMPGEELIQAVPETAYLYDAVHLYTQTLLKALDEGRDPRNGKEIISSLYGLHYRSAMGYMVYMDENGDPEGNYTLIALDSQAPKGQGLYPIGLFIGKENGTNLPQLRVIRNIPWVNGKPPIDEPYCGYHGEKCYSHTGEIVGGIAGGLILVFIAISLILYRNWKYEQELDSLLWKVNYKDIEIKETKEDTTSSGDQLFKNNSKNPVQPHVRTSQASLSSNPDADFRYSMIYTQVGIYKGRIFAVKKVKKKSIEITREMKKELKIMRDLRHDNLNAFIGACTDPPNICIVVEYCARGSLKDILENEDIKLDNMFMASLVGDIVRGMIYLHESIVKFHGSLSTSNCLVDSRWVVKLADFGLHEFKRDAELEPADVMKKYRGLLYKAPELLRSRSAEPTVRDFQKGDVYSFAIVLYELQGRHGPYGITELSAPDILKRVITVEEGIPLFRPPLDQLENSFDFVRECLLECWAENPDTRPDFKVIRNKLRPLRKGMKPNIFDNMMAMMEKYANNLEALVDERTDQLSEEKKKTDALLYEMLPRYVAEQLKRGHKVEAENFDCVTIYFSDIVGFTSMSAESTPLQVVDFLNDLYTCFDSTIENYDVYKVETIGDAYMVVSGLPIRNGIQHAAEIASMSLHLLNAIKQFTIRHRPLDKLQLRIGIHSGPVCAGVVGLKMPRYCLFGDTVNTASRMESTGQPLRIHCSSETKALLDQLRGFTLAERGLVSMKGKGERLTYWLIGEEPTMREARNRERQARRDGLAVNPPQPSDLLPRSSLKNKSLVRATFLRCSSESPKRLRFASSDHLDQAAKGVRNADSAKLESIVDGSPCNGRTICSSGRSSCMEGTRSSSSSCPCVEHIGEMPSPLQLPTAVQLKLAPHLDTTELTNSAPILRADSPFAKEDEDEDTDDGSNYYSRVGGKVLRLGLGKRGLLKAACRSAPSSPKRGSTLLISPKRAVQSNEELDEWDNAPLIYSDSPAHRLEV